MKYIIFGIFCLIGIHCYSQTFTNNSLEQGLNFPYGAGEYAGGGSFVDFDGDGDDDLTVVTKFGSNLRFFENIDGVLSFIDAPITLAEETKQALWVDYDNDGDNDLYITSLGQNKLFRNNGDFTFEDITDICGFEDPEEATYAAVWFDYNNDGLIDVCTSHRTNLLVGSITLYQNIGNDTFQDVTTEAGLEGYGSSVLCMAAFDFNNDGLEDLYVGQDFQDIGSGLEGNLLFSNLGNGSFEDVSETSGANAHFDSMTCTVGDFNNDGWMDIYVTHTNEPAFFVNNSDGTFTESSMEFGLGQDEFSFGAAFVDVDNDMDLDLYRCGRYQSFLFENPSNGTAFIDITDEAGMTEETNNSQGCSLGSLNLNGSSDIFVLRQLSPHAFWQIDSPLGNYLYVNLTGTVSNRNAIGAVIELYVDGTNQYKRIGCGEGFCSQHSFNQHFGLADYSQADSLIVKWPSGNTSVLYDINSNQALTIVEPAEGCTNSTACNYNEVASFDNGSCLFPEEFYDCENECLADTDLDGICNEFEIPGCQDSSACNYDQSATDSDGSCFYPEEYFNCEGNCISDADGDGTCDELEVLGCTDLTACNYNLNATEEDDSCIYLETFEIIGEEAPWLENNTSFSYSYPINTGSTYEWEAENGTIISGQNSSEILVEWDFSGPGTLTLIETNVNGCSGEAVIYAVNITETSILEQNLDNIQLYPNPSQGIFRIKNIEVTTLVLVYNDLGQLVHSVNSQDDLDLSFLDHGVYTIELPEFGKRFRATKL